MREFGLVNELGQSFGLNNVKTGFMQNPTGMGYTMEYGYAKVGARWKELYMRDVQATMGGEVVFATTSPYEAQVQFLQFVRSSKKISFWKKTPAGTYYRDVAIVGYDITEITTGNVLSCPITMIATSLWYTSSAERAAIIASSDNEFRFPVTWPARLNDYSDGYLNIDNNGSCEADIEVEFYGSIDNPSMSIEVNDVEIASVDITASVASGHRIIYSSKDGNLYCFSGTDAAITEFKRNGTTTNLTNLVLGFSLENENFLKLPVGNSKLHITADSTIENPIMISIYKYFRAV